MSLWSKLAALFRKEKIDADMAEEMRAHLDLQIEENIACGMSSEEARYAALRAFGGVEQVKERAREQRGWRWIEQLVADIQFSLRSLKRSLGFTVAMIATLALGIGAATSIFTVTADPLFRKGPYPNAPELLAIGWKDKWTPFGLDLSGLQLRAYQEQTNVFASYAAIEGRMANVVVAGEPAPANHVTISIGGFSTLGIAPALGRGFFRRNIAAGARVLAARASRREGRSGGGAAQRMNSGQTVSQEGAEEAEKNQTARGFLSAPLRPPIPIAR